MKFRTQYEPAEARKGKFLTVNTEPTLTEQHHAHDADINVIMAKYQKTGQLPQLTVPAQYGDFSNVPDFRTALDMIRERTDTFKSMPPKIRERFHNDPAKFVDFVSDPENREELYTMGLATKPEKPDTPPADKLPNGEPKP